MKTIAFTLEPSMESSDAAEPVLVIRLMVGLDLALDMLPYPSSHRSVVTREVFQDATAKLDPRNQSGGLVLRDLRIAGQDVPEVQVRTSLAPSRVGVDGFLGLDFFSNFDRVEWQPKTGLMRLIIDDGA